MSERKQNLETQSKISKGIESLGAVIGDPEGNRSISDLQIAVKEYIGILFQIDSKVSSDMVSKITEGMDKLVVTSSEDYESLTLGLKARIFQHIDMNFAQSHSMEEYALWLDDYIAFMVDGHVGDDIDCFDNKNSFVSKSVPENCGLEVCPTDFIFDYVYDKACNPEPLPDDFSMFSEKNVSKTTTMIDVLVARDYISVIEETELRRIYFSAMRLKKIKYNRNWVKRARFLEGRIF